MNIKSIIRRFKKYLKIEHKTYERLKELPRYTPSEITIQGQIVRFPDAASFVAMYEEIFLKNVYKFRASTESPLIIDCGANIGVSTIFFKSLYPNARVIAFEPDKTIYNYLSNNIKAFRYKNVQIINKGVWIEDGELAFLSEGADAGRVVKAREEREESRVRTIAVERLSYYLTEPVDFLKIDIEGSEVEVLKEIESNLPYVQNIFIEYHSFMSREQELDVILNILSRNGFRYYIYSPFNLSSQPFINKKDFLSMDCLLNICASRETK